MKVLVCGGRFYDHLEARDNVFRALDALHSQTPIVLIISGACVDKKDKRKLRGADAVAIEWAIVNEIDFNGRPARWRLDGYPQAGPMRNGRMLAEERPDLVVAFPGGHGTWNMVTRARAAGVNVLKVGGMP